MDNYNIKNVTKNDIDAILEIEKETFSTPWNKKAFLIEISKSNSGVGIFLVAKHEDNNVLGYIVGDIIVDYVHITNFAVKKDYRNRGIGTMLLKNLEKIAYEKGLSFITLEVREFNYAAINLYVKQGFIIKGRREKFYENKEDALILWKYIL